MAMAMVRVSAVTTAAKATGATIGAAAKTTMAAMATAKVVGTDSNQLKAAAKKMAAAAATAVSAETAMATTIN